MLHIHVHKRRHIKLTYTILNIFLLNLSYFNIHVFFHKIIFYEIYFVFQTGWSFADADDFHPDENKLKMSQGLPLNDQVQ